MTEEYFIKVSFITQGLHVMYPLVSGLCLLFLFISLLSLMLFSSLPFPLSVTSPISHLRLPPSCDLLSTFPDLSRPLDCGVKDRSSPEKKDIVFFSSPLEEKQTAQKHSVWPELTSPSHLVIGVFPRAGTELAAWLCWLTIFFYVVQQQSVETGLESGSMYSS